MIVRCAQAHLESLDENVRFRDLQANGVDGDGQTTFDGHAFQADGRLTSMPASNSACILDTASTLTSTSTPGRKNEIMTRDLRGCLITIGFGLLYEFRDI